MTARNMVCAVANDQQDKILEIRQVSIPNYQFDAQDRVTSEGLIPGIQASSPPILNNKCT